MKAHRWRWLTLHHPSKLRNRRPSGRRFLFTADQWPPAGDPRLTSDLVRRDQPLPSELRGKSVHVHLVVLVLRPWSDRAFNHLTHSVD